MGFVYPLLAVPLILASSASAQLTTDGCLRLTGSVACPGFANAWLNPANLSQAFPFFEGITTVGEFDAGALNYLSDPYQYRQTKFVEELGCTNSSAATIRYERTVLCSQWVNEQWSIACLDKYNASQVATGPKMVCQTTCNEFSASEYQITDSQEFCPGSDLTDGFRATNLTKDFVDCTNWTTLATNDSATCVEGDTNEGNCGYGSSTAQLCAFCNASTPDDCCYLSTTDISTCGYTLAVLPTTTSASATASATGSSSAVAAFSKSGLSGGQIAGIVVGSVAGALLLLALLLLLLVCGGCLAIGAFGKKRKEKRKSRAESFAASGATPRIGPPTDPRYGSPDPSMPPMSELSGGGTGLFTGPASSRTMVPETSSSFAGSSDKLMKGGNAGSAAGLGLGAVVGATTAGRVLLSHVRDENQSGEHLILPNSTVTVLWPYAAALPDELTLRPGMKLQVLRIYDDAWGTGQIMDGDVDKGRTGAFPLVCVTENNMDDSPQSGEGEGNDGSVRWSGSQSHE